MRKNIKITAAAAATAALAFGLTACGTDSDPAAKSGSGAGADTSKALVVAASPTPHADILNYVKKNLADKAGLKLEVKEFTDYVLPNTATESGQVDANFFQHKPYLDDFNEKNGTHIVPVVNVHLEPLGLYSKKVKDVKDLKAGQTVAVPNDTTNEGRALQLLAENGLITLKDGVGTNAKLSDITDKKGLEFKELEAATVPRALDDVDAAVINGNYAIEADLEPGKDSLVLESADDNPYANFLAVKEGNEKDARVQKLAKLLNSDEVKKFIEDTYQGSIIPAFGEPAKS
ncbi:MULTISPECIES: MetQ/NlpA family ABC transporter substrate-binding protein [Streptomyces]|uniref:Lipoprotein n=1 Tax=Streptomyces clavifer TaxID=68188 RepID=A0ABS4VF16_9ACTN|nr:MULTISPECIES: MetQ/NlpA family ABC transporter substrate-binding protein [Streptomyces]KQX89750.1 metal ABC transporter substrate-binding protein [Streptomyces sp. Root1319]KQZ20559.1 metal ABC transporter substrate-binding protein [Streptomyces sp. Root55]MBP2362455.1 D-methionine transport system substrate-binding protein [Streptomyces clavifer]MDX2745347.1 MetQ/NlpA family ABC transporter substrate-binding protein [Streptomyces sp. NRRL_B-2557]MDX3061706.1 MetQ/NlpA family ABC transporte